MNTRKNRTKRIKTDGDYDADFEPPDSPASDDKESERKSRIRDSNKEFARRMTILTTWANFWSDYELREGEAYPQNVAKEMMRKSKKVACPIEKCDKTFTTLGGLRYHYARCGFERKFMCNVCAPAQQLQTRGDLLKHMIRNHVDDLPALNEEQKEIVNSYRSCTSRGEKGKRDKRLDNETEPVWNAANLVKAFAELRNRVYQTESYNRRPFRDWLSFSKDFELVVNEYDRKRYYPPELESVKFKNEKLSWNSLDLGASRVLTYDKKGLPLSTVFFTGGINTASAWLPKSLNDKRSSVTPDLVAISVNCCSMDESLTYKDVLEGDGCIQFWTFCGDIASKIQPEGDVMPKTEPKMSLSYMIGHRFGTIFEMSWCPLGTSWQSFTATQGEVLPRVGLLALACGDGKVRILSIPHTSSLSSRVPNRHSSSILENVPLFRVKPIACLMAPGVGPATEYQAVACKSIFWNMENSQKLIAAGYSNGSVAIYDLSNNSPIVYANVENTHIYQPLRTWVAHGGPISSIALSAPCNSETVFVATGSIDRQLKIWNPLDLNSCISTDRAPITRLVWDFRFRGVITAMDAAFTSYHNRVSYRHPNLDGNHNITVSVHRATVLGLSNSIVTNSIITADSAGEVFVVPQLISRQSHHRRDRNILCTHSLYTILPKPLEDCHLLGIQQNTNVSAQDLISSVGPTLESAHDENCIKYNVINATEEDVGAENNNIEQDVSFIVAEREVCNKPTKFLLPIEHRPVETYSDFKQKYGLEFVDYSQSTAMNAKLPESCTRAADPNNIYCDRPCDYPFSAINTTTWSPNVDSFANVLSATQTGLCRIDRVQIVEQIYKGYTENLSGSK